MDHSDCLGQEELTQYLEGGLDPAIKTVTEVHLLTCDQCRESLALLMRVMKSEMTPEEGSVIHAANDRWTATKVGGRIVERPIASRFMWLIAVAAVLILGLISLPFVVDRNMEPASGEDVVQLLLSQQRPFEAQLSGQPHLPIVRTRGVDDPGISYGLLDSEMERFAADRYQMGRFYLIQKDFTQAIPFLQEAERESGQRAEYHNDLGAAYMEGGGRDLFAKAGDEFRHALDLNPSFAPSVFNMAIFYERTGDAMKAESELQRFLEIDSSSAWASEARMKLEELRRR